MARKSETISFYRKKLPHWEVAGGLYFVTIRRNGSIPSELMLKIREMSLGIDSIAETEAISIKRKIFKLMEGSLDNNHGDSALVKSPCAEIITEAIKSRVDRNIWRMIEYVIMPSHLHLFFGSKSKGLSEIITDFKRWTTMEICRNSKEYGGEKFWQREWFDHWSRSSDYDDKIRKYIRNNPVKAGLVKDYKEWPWGTWR